MEEERRRPGGEDSEEIEFLFVAVLKQLLKVMHATFLMNFPGPTPTRGCALPSPSCYFHFERLSLATRNFTTSEISFEIFSCFLEVRCRDK